MPLFGPIGVGLANALFGVNTGTSGFELQSGMQAPDLPGGVPYQPASPASATPTATPAPASSTSGGPAPPPVPGMQSIDTVTTMRAQMFGPLGAVSV